MTARGWGLQGGIPEIAGMAGVFGLYEGLAETRTFRVCLRSASSQAS